MGKERENVNKEYVVSYETMKGATMKNTFEIQNTTIDFSDYYSKNGISANTQSKTETIEFLAVPTRYEDHRYYFAQETVDFLKYCRIMSPEHSFDILSDETAQVRSLHSFDIWMPVIWVASNVLLPLAVGLISNYIWEKMKGREEEPAKVDVTLLVKNGVKEKYLHYSGDAKTFKESFEQIDLNKMWSDDSHA